MISQQGDGLVFLLGVPRSGTTLLATMLAQHPMVLSPPEPWLMLALEAVGQTPFDHPADPQLIGEAFLKLCGDTAKLDAAREYAACAFTTKCSLKRAVAFSWTRHRAITWFCRFSNSCFQTRGICGCIAIRWMSPRPSRRRGKSIFPPICAAQAQIAGGWIWCSGTRQLLADFADAGTPPVHRIAYEQLVAEPASAHGAIAFLGLEPAVDLTHFELHDTALAKSNFGDRKIMETQSPHAQSVGKWETEFPRDDLQTLVDAIGAPLFRRLGYESVLSRLAELGVTEPSSETTAVAQRPVEARFAQRSRQSRRRVHSAAQDSPGHRHRTSLRSFRIRLFRSWWRSMAGNRKSSICAGRFLH